MDLDRLKIRSPELGKVLAMILSLLLLGIPLVIFRWPGFGSSVLMASQLSVFTNYDREGIREKAVGIFSITAAGGMLESVLIMVHSHALLLPCFMFTGVLLILRSPFLTQSGTIAACIAGLFSVPSMTGGIQQAFSGFLLCQTAGLSALIASEAAGRVFGRKISTVPAQGKPPFARDMEFALLTAITYTVYLMTHIPQWYWICFTYVLVHMGGVRGPAAASRGIIRSLMAPLGFLAGFLMLGLFCWFDYRFAYSFPVWIAIGYHFYFRSAAYEWNVFFQMVYFVLLSDLLNGEYRNYDVWNIILCRSSAIAAGSLLAVLTER